VKRPDRVRADWLRGVRDATLRNLASPAFVAWLSVLRRKARGHALVTLAGERLAADIAYDFRGDAHPTVELEQLRRRGWGACSDAAAVAAAVVVAERLPGAYFAIEAPEGLPFYSHIWVIVPRRGGVAVVADTFKGKRAPLRSSVDFAVGVAELLRAMPATIARVPGNVSEAEAVAS
jgi:hypothetical protein